MCVCVCVYLLGSTPQLSSQYINFIHSVSQAVAWNWELGYVDVCMLSMCAHIIACLYLCPAGKNVQYFVELYT